MTDSDDPQQPGAHYRERSQPDGTTRRDVLKSVAGGACLLAVGTALTGCESGGQKEQTEIKLTETSELTAEPQMLEYAEGSKSGMVYAYLDGDKPVVLSNVCPHQQCRVGWVPDKGHFECPCHASRFEKNGKVINGPARESLQRLKAEVRDGTVFVTI